MCKSLLTFLVDGGYSQWSNWQTCNGNCASGSVSRRTRSCNSPSPSLGGSNCNPVTDVQETALGKLDYQVLVSCRSV